MKQNTVLNFSKLKYRNGVIGLVLNKDKRILIVQSIDYGKDEWRFPGGGIEIGELSKNALLRELLEELGTSKFEILKKSDVVIKYDWPLEVIKKKLVDKGKTYKGQTQIQYLVSFLGNSDEIKADKKELRKIKWVSFMDLRLYFKFPGQWENARKTIDRFGI